MVLKLVYLVLHFHPIENYFLVNYSNKKNALIVEKYYINNLEVDDSKQSENILYIPNSITGHFGGNIFWSDYFNDFMIAIGDMQIQSNTITLNHESLDTTTPRGKIILLNTFISNPDLISENPDSEGLKNILGFGLRSPWQIAEFDNLLFVTDVGNFNFEELNIVNLVEYSNNNNRPFLFGWPIYEGVAKTGVVYEEVLLWKNKEDFESIFQYIDDNSTFPIVFYNHNSPDVYRGAIIGGDILNLNNSSYQNTYVFTDFSVKKFFLYNYKNDSLNIYPLPQGYSTFTTSVKVSPFSKILLFCLEEMVHYQ